MANDANCTSVANANDSASNSQLQIMSCHGSHLPLAARTGTFQSGKLHPLQPPQLDACRTGGLKEPLIQLAQLMQSAKPVRLASPSAVSITSAVSVASAVSVTTTDCSRTSLQALRPCQGQHPQPLWAHRCVLLSP